MISPDDIAAAMADPGFYPHRPQQVELRQTHISRVFIAGEYVYKIKKPLRFTFLDYSTLEQRYHFCQEEVRLNRRLAPGIYLGVFAILPAAGGPVIADGPSQRFDPHAAEYAVKMRRLPLERSLESLIIQGAVEAGQIEQVGSLLAKFHAGAAREHSIEYGSASAVAQSVSANLEECRPFLGDTLGEREFNFIGQFDNRFAARHRDLLDRRAREGWVREGHGDLRSEHVCLTGEIDVIDCVEFSEQLRYGDIASDTGFLLMDLDRLGAPAMGQRLLRAYLAEIGDSDFSRLLNYYKCYRAAVRGKVATLKTREAEVAPEQRSRARESALAFFGAAYHYAKAGSPALIVICGLPASGKSSVAAALAERSGLAAYNSDVVRKQLAGLAPTQRAARNWGEGIYSSEFSAATYQALADAAAEVLRGGDGVIVDATCKDVSERLRLCEIAHRAGVPVVFAECTIDETQARRRLLARAQRPDAVSDADWEIYLRHQRSFAPFGPQFSGCHLRLDAARDPAESAFTIESFITENC